MVWRLMEGQTLLAELMHLDKKQILVTGGGGGGKITLFSMIGEEAVCLIFLHFTHDF